MDQSSANPQPVYMVQQPFWQSTAGQVTKAILIVLLILFIINIAAGLLLGSKQGFGWKQARYTPSRSITGLGATDKELRKVSQGF